MTVQLPDRFADAACTVLKQSRGGILGYEIDRLASLTATVPVEAAFGLSERLRKATSGHAFTQCAFDSWALLPGEWADEESLAGKALQGIRRRKGLPPHGATVADLVDKL